MPRCVKCGREVEEAGQRYCRTCSLNHEAIRRGEGGIHWESDIPLVANSLLWQEILVALGVTVLIIALIVILVSKTSEWLLITAFFAILYIAFILIALLVLVAISRSLEGGFSARFYANNAGVGFDAGRQVKILRSGTHVLWLLSGLIDAAGPNLKSLTHEENFIAWRDIAAVRVYHRPKVLLIRSKERLNPLSLYCTPENFEKILEMFQKRVPLANIST
jgi:hypothetical protein